MRYRFLGRTSLAVSELCLGAMTFGRETDDQVSLRMLDTFAEAGGTFVDTSDAYSDGLSEEIVGRWLPGRERADVVVSTKVRWGPDGNREGLGRNYDHDRTWQVVGALTAVAGEVGRTPAEAALNWLLQRPAVTAPIIGARNPEQLQADLGAAGWDLDPVLVQLLTDISETTPLPYLYDILAGSAHTAHRH